MIGLLEVLCTSLLNYLHVAKFDLASLPTVGNSLQSLLLIQIYPSLTTLEYFFIGNAISKNTYKVNVLEFSYFYANLNLNIPCKCKMPFITLDLPYCKEQHIYVLWKDIKYYTTQSATTNIARQSKRLCYVQMTN